MQIDCCCIGRLSGTKGTVWQYTALDVASSCWAELHTSARNPSEHWCSRPAERVASELAERGSVGSGRPRPWLLDLYQNGLNSPGTHMVAISRWVREPSPRSVS